MAKFSRKGLHRLECPMCPCYGYFTVGMLEKAGQLPECFTPGCGDTLQPTSLDLAMILEATESRPYVEWMHERGSVAHGQAPHTVVAGRNGREFVGSGTPDEIAAERVEDPRRAAVYTRRVASAANARRRGVLVPVEAMPF